MFADKLRGEAWPSDVISGIDGRGPCRYGWAESGAMEITDKIRLGCHLIGTVSIRCGEKQIVSNSGLRVRSEVDVV